MQPTVRNLFNQKHHDPFGMLLVGRNWEGGSEYRFGFNGKESDKETYGEGNVYDYGERVYIPRIGTFFSIDKYFQRIPNLTGYNFANLSPISAIDHQGDSTVYINENGDILMTSFNKLTNAVVVIHNTENFKFNVTRILKESGGLNLIDNGVVDAFFRRYGDSYLIDEFFKMDDEFKTEQGETATWIDKTEEGWYFPKLDDNRICDISPTTNSILDEKEAPIPNGPRVHLHRTDSHSDPEPGVTDISGHTNNKEGHNIVIGNDKESNGKRKLTLYNYKGDHNSNLIYIKRDIISAQKNKTIQERALTN